MRMCFAVGRTENADGGDEGSYVNFIVPSRPVVEVAA